MSLPSIDDIFVEDNLDNEIYSIFGASIPIGSGSLS
jgi:hypothetical protein